MSDDLGHIANRILLQTSDYTLTLARLRDLLAAATGPRIDSFTPLSGQPGTMLTIHGANFQGGRTANTVTVGGHDAYVLEATPTMLQVIVSLAATSGPVQVTAEGKTGAGPVDFQRLPPPRASDGEDGPPVFFAGAGNPPTAGIDAHGSPKVLVAITFATDKVPANSTTLRTAVKTEFDKAQEYYHQVSYGATDLQIDYTTAIALTGAYDDYVDASIDNIANPDGIDRICAEAAQGAVDQGLDIDDYDFMLVVLFLDGGFIRAWGGFEKSNFAYNDGSTSINISTSHPVMMVCIGDNADYGRVAHELGHGFVDPGAVLGEDIYGSDLIDPANASAQMFDLMGSHDTHPAFSGHFMNELAYYSSSNVLDLEWDRNPFSQSYVLVAHGTTQNANSGRRHLIRIRVGGGVFYYVEVRQLLDPSSSRYDTQIPVPAGESGGVVVTKVFTDVVNVNQEMRFVSLLHDPETQSQGAIIEDPARGLRITVGSVVSSNPLTMNVTVEWAQTVADDPAGTFDLRLTQTSVAWVSDDIWVDRQPWGVTNETDGDGHIVATREKPRPGEVNRLYGQVFNSGPEDVTNVRLTYYAITPPGVGDNGAWAPIAMRTLASCPANSMTGDYVSWTPTVGEHTCLKVYASPQFGEITAGNNQAQENVFYFAPAANSPPEPVRMKIAIRNPLDEPAAIPVAIHGVPAGYAVHLPHSWYLLPAKGERTVELVILPHLDIKAYLGLEPVYMPSTSGKKQDDRRAKLRFRTATIDVKGYVPRLYKDRLPVTDIPGFTYLPIGGIRAAVTPKRGVDIKAERDRRKKDAIAVRGWISPALDGQRIEVMVSDVRGQRQYLTTRTDAKGAFQAALDCMPPPGGSRKAWDGRNGQHGLRGVYEVICRVADASDVADVVAAPIYFQFGDAAKPDACDVGRIDESCQAKRVDVAAPVDTADGSRSGNRPETTKGNHMMANQKDLNIVAEIKRRHGSVIDLDKSPMTIIEIIHNFRYLLDEVAGPDGTGGGPPGRRDPGEVGTAAVLNLLLELKRDIDNIKTRIR